MNDNDPFINKKQTSSDNNTDDTSGVDNRIFDVSDDNISLVTDNSTEVPKSSTPVIPPNKLTNNAWTSKPKNITQKKPSVIPIQDLPSSINKIISPPENPSVKNVPLMMNQDKPKIFNVLETESIEKNPTLAQKFGPDAKTTNSIPSTPTTELPKNQTGLEPEKILKSFRTYESDVADVMSHKRTSIASMAIAESKKSNNENTEQTGSIGTNNRPQSSKKFFMIILSLIFIAGGFIGVYYFYSISPLAKPKIEPPVQQIANSIIPSDNKIIINLESFSPLDILSKIQNEVYKNQPENTIKEIIPSKKSGVNVNTRINAPEMISSLDISLPDILLRSLTSEWMLGVYNNQENKKSVFVVVTTNFFQNTFSGMLQWENVMADDLRQYFLPSSVRGVSNSGNKVSSSTNSFTDINSILPNSGNSSPTTTNSTSTTKTTTSTSTKKITTTKPPTTKKTTTKSSSTKTNTLAGSTELANDQNNIENTPIISEQVQAYQTIRGRFEDRIIKNKDVRAFRSTDGVIIFLYSFIDNKHLIITDSEATLVEVLNRLEKQAFIR